MQSVKNELMGNYPQAISGYLQIIQNWQDSLTAINSLRRLLYCRDKMNSDSTIYNQLRSHYLTLSQTNQNDTVFRQVANELASKCLVRIEDYPGAITEYENIASTSSDTLEVLCAELNIIETYMIMYNSGNGNAPQFIGKLKHLKPLSIEEGYKMILHRLNSQNNLKQNEIIPKEFNLAQNYPNPFNPYTYINYSLPKGVKVVIKVYDILGKLVKELVNEYKDAGYYTVKFDGTNYASGVYFYRIEAGTFIDTKKMVLVK